MLRVRGLLVPALAALLAACKPTPPPTANDLAYPVLVLWEAGGVVRHDDAKDLQVMSTGRVVNANSPPFLVDSRLDVYRLDKLASTHGGMWLMANPVGRTDVTFELALEKQGDAELARRLIAERDVDFRYQGDAAAKEKLAQSRTLAQMLDAIGR
ncbi:MAG TPA: hypothetical protein VFL14_06325 [Xanthomonadales bacterium]|nr:hypothetical protein [Xanthomonadales bacterium]